MSLGSVGREGVEGLTEGRDRARVSAVLGLVLVVAVAGWIGIGVWLGVGAATTPPGDSLPQIEPTANLTASPNPAGLEETVLLDARDSTGGNATVESCAFDADGDGSTDVQTEECVAEWTYEAVGEYQAVVRVEASDGGIDTATTQVTVVENRAPIPAIAFEPEAPQTGESVTLSAGESRDPDGRIVRTAWRLPDRTFSGETVTVTFPEPGEYQVSLVVTDDDGRENATERTIGVRANDPPSAGLAVASEDPRAGDPVDLDATGSRDADGEITEFRWDFDGDGAVDRTTETGQTAFVAEESGTRTASVVIVDDDGASASATITFEVAPAATTEGNDATPDAPSDDRTSASGGGLLWALDAGLVPLVPDWLAILVVAVAAVGAGGAWRRRQAIRARIDGIRDRITRGDFRRRAASTASGAVTKTTAKRLLRSVADAIDAGGNGVGGGLERLGRAIKRWSGRVADALRRLAS